MLTALEQLSGARLAVWHGDGRRIPAGAGAPDGDDWVPPLEGRTAGHSIATPHGPAWFEPVPDIEGVWLEIGAPGPGPRAPDTLAAIVGAALGAERDAAQVAAELSERYEEIDLIYTISEILGQTIRLDEAADRILREVSGVVRARRATLLVHDRERGLLRIVAAQGVDVQDIEPIEVDDACSVAARVFREMRIVSYDPTDPQAVNPGCPEGRTYRGKAFLSVPVLYATPGERAKPIGVINLTPPSRTRSAPRSRTPRWSQRT